MITITGTLSKAWMSGALGVVFDREYYFDPACRHAIDCLCNEYAVQTFPGLSLFYSESNLGRIDYWDESQVQIGGIQPNMILGMLLGADFFPADNRDADITPGCLKGKTVDDLPAPGALLNHDLVRLFRKQIKGQRGEHLRPIPPFFWGETIFMDMLTEPEKCMRLLNWIADAYITLCRHFAQAADLPITDVHVGECSGCMVSPALVEEFVAPVTSRIGAALGPVRFHSCGTSTHLLQALTRIDHLHSLDLGSETSVGQARTIFGRQMPITIAPSPQAMSAGDTTPILDWAQRVLDENSGGPLGYVFHLEPSYNVETIHALTDLVRRQPDFQNTGGLRNG
jgi:hypothetical protein